ncbi:hypothetical protein ES703_80382 [subsurface metagenome]
MSKMTTVSQTHTHNSIAIVKQGIVCCHISLSPAVRLDISMLSMKQLFSSLDSQTFYYIHIFTATIVTLFRITLSIFVG